MIRARRHVDAPQAHGKQAHRLRVRVRVGSVLASRATDSLSARSLHPTLAHVQVSGKCATVAPPSAPTLIAHGDDRSDVQQLLYSI